MPADHPATSLSSAAALAAGFSHPGAGTCADALEVLTDGWALHSIAGLLAAGAVPDGTADCLGTAVAQPLPGIGWASGSWDLVGLNRPDATRRSCLAACAAITAAGRPGAWSINLDARARVRCGDILLPAGRSISAHHDGERGAIVIDGALVARARGAGPWQLLPGAGGTRLATVVGGTVPCYVDDDSCALDLEAVPREFRSRLSGTAPTCVDAAVALLSRADSPTLDWVRRATKVLVVHAGQPGRRESGSAPGQLGLLRVSAEPSAPGMAEMLVHEASHQHLYALGRLGPFLENPEDRGWSPLKGEARPLEKILLGFHAFANIALLHRALAREPGTGDYLADEGPELARQCAELWSTLHERASLTELGDAVVRPLAEELAL